MNPTLREISKVVLSALALTLFIRSFLYEPFYIPSRSMLPNLMVGDYIFTSKASYGYSRYSFPFSLPLFGGRLWGVVPERGDIAVFRRPSQTGEAFIKRVIGLPGDRVRVAGGRLYLNGEQVRREELFSSPPALAEGGEAVDFARVYREILPDGRSYHIREYSDTSTMDDTEEYHVPNGHYFMLGDNRDASRDSRDRVLIGFVPYENLVGRAEVIFYSLDSVRGPWWQLWRWLSLLRYERLFMVLR